MKIDPASIGAAGSLAGSAITSDTRVEKTKSEESTSGISSSGGSTDQVQLSNLLGRLREAASNENEVTPERAAYLEKLKSEVSSGEYNVDAKALSSKIVDDTLQGIA